MKKIVLILFAIILAINLNAKAHDFSAIYNGNTIYYKITSSTSPLTVSVTYAGISYMDYQNEYIGLVSIPNSVQYNNNYYNVIAIDSGTFYNCNGLTSIILPNAITTIPYCAFFGCSLLTTITIPNSLTSIGDDAFIGCTGLTSINIPNSVTSIGISAFSGCIGLTSIIIPNSVTSIGLGAFSACTGLASVTISNSVTSIEQNTFINCHGLLSIIIPSSVTSIGDDAFGGCSGLTSINIPNSVTSIGNATFQYCSGLTSLTIPNAITSIGDQTFYSCSGLTSLTIPNSVTSIGYSAFGSCSGLTSINIPNSVISIGNNAFNNCTALTSINIPSSVTSIGSYAFTNCGLSSITCEAINPPSIQSNSLFGISQFMPFYVPCNSIPLYQSATYWSLLGNLIGIKTVQHIDTSICEGSIYSDYGAIIDSAGIYTFIDGCDSIILNLSIIPSVITIFNDTICKGMQYSNYEFNFISDTTGTYTRTLQAINGCDSIITLNLIVNQVTTPTNLVLDNIQNYFELSFQSDAENYIIYRNNDSIGSTTNTIFIDTNVIDGTNYCYKVKAFEGDCEAESIEICQVFIGLNEIIDNPISITLYPNPTSSSSRLEIDNVEGNIEITITDISGRKIQTMSTRANNKFETTIDLTTQSKGIYFISIVTEKTKRTEKLILK